MTEKVKPTLITFLIDRSSSMGAIWDDTIDGFNTYLKMMQGNGEDIKFTLLQFDYDSGGFSIQKDCVAEPIASVKPLDKTSYQPRGSTPLIEAAHKTIDAVDASLEKFDTEHQVIVCIQTDGQENHSAPEYTWEGLKAKIEAKTKAGWVFNFMGTGLDAYDQGAKMGIMASNTISTGTSREHVTKSYAAMAMSNTRFAGSGVAGSAAYLQSERDASGEHTILGNHSKNPPKAAKLDLGPGQPKTKSAKPKNKGLDLTP